ncbi:MAG: radical SAM protein [Spirochaetes bacterium]|nr:MAG: radical SAM protein [Spirochaetota bacterium]
MSCQDFGSHVKIYPAMYNKSYKKYYTNCSLCPRECRVDRTVSAAGFCRETDRVRIAWAGLHYGEEPTITGKKGSGAVFFTGCTLKCVFCQNYQVSGGILGGYVSSGELTEIMLGLQKVHAENINLVTGTHFIPHIIDSVEEAKKEGLRIPVVWNTSGFEKIISLKLIENTVDIFLTDIKTLSHEYSKKLFNFSNYPEVAIKAVNSMADMKPIKKEDGKLLSGVIVRHLVMPGMLDSTFKVLKLFKDNWYGKAILSLMFQYIPVKKYTSAEIDNLTKMLTEDEYSRVMDFLYRLNIDEGYMQEFSYGSNVEWMPDFSRCNPFPEGMAKTLWHYREDCRGQK